MQNNRTRSGPGAASGAPAKGFTLVELLIVIAIISVLTAILLPVFAMARDKARQTACVSNLRQLGQAMTMYYNDHDGRLPGSGEQNSCGSTYVSDNSPGWMSGFAVDNSAVYSSCNPVFTNGYGDLNGPIDPRWTAGGGPKQGALYPYVKNAQVFVCPSDPRGKDRMLSYSMNAIAGFLTEAAVQRPAQFALLVDEQYTLNDGFFLAGTDCPSLSHAGGATLNFMDGHAKWYRGTHKVDT